MGKKVELSVTVDLDKIKRALLSTILFITMFSTGISAVTLSADNIDLDGGNILSISEINPNGQTVTIGGTLDLGNNALKNVGSTMCQAEKAILGDGSCKTVSTTLSDVLDQDNTANKDINMNNNDIDNINYLLGNSGPITIGNALNLDGNNIQLNGGSISNNGGNGLELNNNGRITTYQGNLDGRDQSSEHFIGKYTPSCCDDTTQPDNGNFTGFTTAWDTDFASFGLRNYGDNRKDVVINNEQTNDDIRVQSEGKDRVLIKGNGGVTIYDGNLVFEDNIGIKMGSGTSSNIQMNNGHIYGAHKLHINDPGPSKGIDWGSNQEIYSAPLDDSNQRGNLQYHSGNYDHTFRNGKVIIQDNNLDLNNNNIEGVNQINGQPISGEYSLTCSDWNNKGWQSEMHCIQDGRTHVVESHTESYTCSDIAQDIYDNRGYYEPGVTVFITFDDRRNPPVHGKITPQVGEEMYFFDPSNNLRLELGNNGNIVQCDLNSGGSSYNQYRVNVRY